MTGIEALQIVVYESIQTAISNLSELRLEYLFKNDSYMFQILGDCESSLLGAQASIRSLYGFGTAFDPRKRL